MRTFDPNSMQVTFEERADLAPEFDVVKPEGFKWGFELPKDVDFYIHLGRHCSTEDFEQMRAFIQDISPDVFLFETGSDPFSQQLLNGASSGDRSELYEAENYLGLLCPPHQIDFNLEVLRTIHDYMLPTIASDPPPSHPSIKATEQAGALWDVENPEIYYSHMRQAMDDRDIWLLHNMKKMIDKAVQSNDGQRRTAVIFRGGCHFRFLRSLEHQIEYNPRKANGSQIIASVVELTYRDGQSTEDVMFDK